MDPATLQSLFQLGFFGLLCLLGYWTKGWIESGNKKCEETTAKLGAELKESHAETKRMLETTIKESNDSRIQLTETLKNLPCLKAQSMDWDGKDRRNHA